MDFNRSDLDVHLFGMLFFLVRKGRLKSEYRRRADRERDDMDDCAAKRLHRMIRMRQQVMQHH
jgi:hypothetical protein